MTRRGFTKTSFDVFHLDGERGFRGGERQLLYLAAALRSRGHRNTVVCRGAGPLAREAARLGLKTSFLPFLTEWDPVSAFRLRALALASENPLLHAHTGHTAALARLASLGGALPYVAHRRVDFPLSGALSRGLKYDSAGAVVGVSRAIAAILRDAGVRPAKIEVIADAIPASAQECAWAGMPEDRFAAPTAEVKSAHRLALADEFDIPAAAAWVGNVAALVPHKDHETLIAAAWIVLRKRPQTVFLIAGEGPEAPRLLKKIRRMDLEGKVLLVGHRPDPVPLLKALDLFVLSSWGEGMGSVGCFDTFGSASL